MISYCWILIAINRLHIILECCDLSMQWSCPMLPRKPSWLLGLLSFKSFRLRLSSQEDLQLGRMIFGFVNCYPFLFRKLSYLFCIIWYRFIYDAGVLAFLFFLFSFWETNWINYYWKISHNQLKVQVECGKEPPSSKPLNR